MKELTRVLNPTFPDGSRREPSGRGFFNGEINGIDATVKDSKRFAKTNGWGFFTFGHHPETVCGGGRKAGHRVRRMPHAKRRQDRHDLGPILSATP